MGQRASQDTASKFLCWTASMMPRIFFFNGRKHLLGSLAKGRPPTIRFTIDMTGLIGTNAIRVIPLVNAEFECRASPDRAQHFRHALQAPNETRRIIKRMVLFQRHGPYFFHGPEFKEFCPDVIKVCDVGHRSPHGQRFWYHRKKTLPLKHKNCLRATARPVFVSSGHSLLAETGCYRPPAVCCHAPATKPPTTAPYWADLLPQQSRNTAFPN